MKNLFNKVNGSMVKYKRRSDLMGEIAVTMDMSSWDVSHPSSVGQGTSLCMTVITIVGKTTSSVLPATNRTVNLSVKVPWASVGGLSGVPENLKLHIKLLDLVVFISLG